MRIIYVKPFYFRAFCDTAPVLFNDILTIFYGANGTGKSSLSEALEWLFYGYTKRRRRGDEYSKTEYKGCYVHTSCPAGTAPYVEASITLPNGHTHLIRRTITLGKTGIPIDHESSLEIDGHPAENLSPIGITYTEAHCPVVVQQGIQDFIHTRPIDRYRVISEALGLSELVEFKDVLERAKNHRRNNPSPDVARARTTVAQLVSKARSVGLDAMAIRWQTETFVVDADYSEVLEEARKLSGSRAATFEEVLRDVRIRQGEAIHRVFDLTPFRPNPSSVAILEQGYQLVDRISEVHDRLAAAAGAYAGMTVSTYQTAQLEFWKQGLSLLSPEHPALCPFCDEQTITTAKIRDIRARLDLDQNLSRARSAFLQEIDQYLALLSQIGQKLPPLDFQAISDDSLSVLAKLFEQEKARLQAFATTNRQSAQVVRSFCEAVAQSEESLQTLRVSIDQPDKVLAAIASVADIPTRLGAAWCHLNDTLKQYSEIYAAFTPIFEQELSDEASVAVFTGFIDILTNRQSLQLAAEAKALDNRIVEVQRIVEEYVLLQQKAALAKREAEILAWYSLLSPNPDVKFSGLEPGRNEFCLKAEAFGRTMNAAASLSQSQLNCLGLSIYIPSVAAPDSPFRFILFDDPVQAMDDDHHESFLLNVVPEIMKKHQLFLSSETGPI